MDYVTENIDTDESADPELLLEYIKHLNSVLEFQTKLVFDATRYNFTAFGAVFLLGNAPFYKDIVSVPVFVTLCSLIIAANSVACVTFVVNRTILSNLARKKRSVSERTLYRRRDFRYFRKKFDEEMVDIITNPSDLRWFEYISYPSAMKAVNFIPATFALVTIVYVIVREVTN